MLCAQSELLQQRPGGAGVSELVVDADPTHECGLSLSGAHTVSQSADNTVKAMLTTASAKKPSAVVWFYVLFFYTAQKFPFSSFRGLTFISRIKTLPP